MESDIVFHIQKTNYHCINWVSTTLQRRAKGYWQRTVEAIHIRTDSPNINLDSMYVSFYLMW